MNKIIIAIMSFCMIISLSTTAVAGSVSVPTTSGNPGPALVFNSSPSTLMSVKSGATAFTIISVSSKTTGIDTNATNANGIEYGIDSDTSVLYQMVQLVTGAVQATNTTAILPAGFVDKSNVAAPTS